MAHKIDLCVAFYKAVKDRCKCLICAASNPQFHHVSPSEKISEVHRIARIGNMDLLVNEFNKCVPLCEIHHRDVHSGKTAGWLDGLFDNGRKSDSIIAMRYMPFLDWFLENEKNSLELRGYRF